ncbi:MAG: efflux RND transporter periplasmic adaptor subunit [Candidatus Hydrogenedentes bacterium]|nr:efflux RND transporter periplasmic adaptor subunit [Candidatus Hydrogenedentota bacterium]
MRYVGLGLGVFAVLLSLAGCNNTAEGMPSGQSSGSALDDLVLVPVEATRPARGDISSYFETTTRVEAEKHVQVVSEGVGECIDVLVEEGQAVNEGDVLARLDTKQLETQIRQTRVNVQQARFQMEKAEEQQKEGILSPFELENARFAYEQAAAMLELQELQLEHQTIEAPIGGVVTMRGIQKGQMVATGVPVFRVVDPQSYILPIMPPEKELPRLRLDQVAKVSIDSVEGREFEAHIRRINPSVDPLSGTVKVVLDFEDAARPFLREGSFARVKLIMETHAGVLMVPKDAVIEENARKYLMIVQEEAAPDDAAEEAGETAGAAPAEEEQPALVAERIEIKTGLEDSNSIEVVEGLEEHMLVVTLGQHTLKPGSQVKITTAEDEIDALASLTADEALALARGERRNARNALSGAS